MTVTIGDVSCAGTFILMYGFRFLIFHTCRNPREYFAIFDGIETTEPDGRHAHFELLSCKPVDAYCRIKKNQNQVRQTPKTQALKWMRSFCSALPCSVYWHPNNYVLCGRLPRSKSEPRLLQTMSAASGVSIRLREPFAQLQPLAAVVSSQPWCAPLQICWKWRKVVTDKPQRDNFRAFLDGVQYSRTGILRYERIFGPGFVSTGGLETTKVSLSAPTLLPACHWDTHLPRMSPASSQTYLCCRLSPAIL